MAEVQDSLFFAIVCAEGIHGRAQVRMDAGFRLDEEQRVCVVDAATPLAQTVAQVFTGLLIRELGDDAFTVDRVGDRPNGVRDERYH